MNLTAPEATEEKTPEGTTANEEAAAVHPVRKKILEHSHSSPNISTHQPPPKTDKHRRASFYFPTTLPIIPPSPFQSDDEGKMAQNI